MSLSRSGLRLDSKPWIGIQVIYNVIAALLLTIAVQATAAQTPLQPPVVAQDPKAWAQLLDALSEKKLRFGEFAAASRILAFFSDVELKQRAFATLVVNIDQGYPGLFERIFIAGDIIPTGSYSFENSYNFYKATLNQDRGIDRWAQHYFERIDQKNFPKFKFRKAIDAFKKGDHSGAKALLRETLSALQPSDPTPFVAKIARTLARIHFEDAEYDAAWDIYRSFLLKLENVRPSDWLEASWNLYYLKRYREAIGTLYNLESHAAKPRVNLEKYTLRGLIYRNLCAVPNSEALTDSFEQDFGKTLKGLKRGASIQSLSAELERIETDAGNQFNDLTHIVSGLSEEKQNLGMLKSDLMALARYLYDTELQTTERHRSLLRHTAISEAARRLITAGEGLRFLKFEALGERHNPDAVFRPTNRGASDAETSDLKDGSEWIRWNQYGDYWHDERLRYKAMLTSQCAE